MYSKKPLPNDSNRYGFVLHGLKANDFKHINELLIQGIRNCLRDVDYETMQKWAQSQCYRNFDMELINKRLENILRV